MISYETTRCLSNFADPRQRGKRSRMTRHPIFVSALYGLYLLVGINQIEVLASERRTHGRFMLQASHTLGCKIASFHSDSNWNWFREHVCCLRLPCPVPCPAQPGQGILSARVCVCPVCLLLYKSCGSSIDSASFLLKAMHDPRVHNRFQKQLNKVFHHVFPSRCSVTPN